MYAITKIGILVLFAVVLQVHGRRPALSIRPTRKPSGVQGVLFETKKDVPKVIMVPILPDGSLPNMIQKNVSQHIVGGNAAALGQMPWQAAISITRLNYTFFCGGSLINAKWVISAAHCTINTQKIIVRLGSLSPTSGGIVINAIGKYTHPNYNPSNLNNDISVINLGSAVPLSSSIQVIPIVPSSARSLSPLRVSGWGKTSNADTFISSSLQIASVTIISNTQCTSTYGSGVITANTLCTVGNPRQSACQGDSGGPLVLNSTTPYLVGVVSFVSSNGCERGLPSGYINPANYRTWLKSVTGIAL